MPGDAWNPDQYGCFRTERQQPFFDLLALVRPEPGMVAVDLGCGTGELTRILDERLGARETVGIDGSAAMLERAADYAGGDVRFEHADIADFADRGAWDLVFSNAALHWLPAHEALFERLTIALRARGQLAVQVPANFDHPSHVVAVELARDFGISSHQAGVLAPEAYASLLHRLGYAEQHVRLQVYGHPLASSDGVVEWVKGSLLTDYQRRLPPDAFAEFLARYRERLLARLGDARPYFYAFKRILLWGRR
jgi:trans-aconitate 2-methyltransferase